jgi:hypothetical protein
MSSMSLPSFEELLSRAREIARMRPTSIVAGGRAAAVSADGSLVARKDGESNITESGRVSYAEGWNELVVFRSSDGKLLETRRYPYWWNDGDRPDASGVMEGFHFDGNTLVVRLSDGAGRNKQVREERIPIVVS